MCVVFEIWKYVDFDSYDLCYVLVVYYGVVLDNIMIGEGIDGLLGFLVCLMLVFGEIVVILDGVYLIFNYYVVGFGGFLYKVFYCDDVEDFEVLVVVVCENFVWLVYLVNFDNLMGSWYLVLCIMVMLDQMLQGLFLVLDEVYVEFVLDEVIFQIDLQDDWVICFCIFFKVYGMVGVRVGYVIGFLEFIVGFDCIWNYFGMNCMVQIGVLVVLQDYEWLIEICCQVVVLWD